jgi:nucleoid-associated protein YgaU
MPKYSRRKFKNQSETYQFLFDKRSLDFVRQYTSKVFSKKLKTLSVSVNRHTWKQGDKLYKLAASNYGDFRLWWVIALINKISCEADLTYGDIILIPSSPSEIISKL